MSTNTIKVLIFDDHPLMVREIQEAVKQNNIEVVGSASTRNEIIPTIESKMPDVIILDLSMPENKESVGSSTTGVLDIIKEVRLKGIKTIVFSSHLIKYVIKELNKAGISGYIYKGDDLSFVITKAIETVYLGGVFYSQSASKMLFDNLDAELILTKKQLKMIACAQDPSNGEADQHFHESPGAIEQHLQSLYLILGLSGESNQKQRMLEKMNTVGFIFEK